MYLFYTYIHIDCDLQSTALQIFFQILFSDSARKILLYHYDCIVSKYMCPFIGFVNAVFFWNRVDSPPTNSISLTVLHITSRTWSRPRRRRG